MKLTDNEIRDINGYLEARKPLTTTLVLKLSFYIGFKSYI